MSEPFLSEIRIFSFGFAPKGWAFCNGQTLPINQNQALFSLLGTTYGGNGVSTFQLPNLQGRFPIHFGQGAGLSAYTLGQLGGEEAVTLTGAELPNHSHTPQGGGTATQGTPAGAVWAHAADLIYGAPVGADTKVAVSGFMDPQAIGSAGGGQPHVNQPPFLTVNICMALQGIFPSRN